MNAEYFIKRILDGTFSIITVNKLTEALHREGLLHPHLSVRYRPFFNNFDIVETEWLEGRTERAWFYPVAEFSNIVADCARAAELYTPYFEAKKNLC